MIAMLVVGCVLLLVFAVWDFRFAKRPVVALRFLRNRAVLAASWIGFFDFVCFLSLLSRSAVLIDLQVSFYLTSTYLYSFVLVVKPWYVFALFHRLHANLPPRRFRSLVDANYFSSCVSVALTVFGICAGVYMRFAHRYKWLLVVGLVIRLAYVFSLSCLKAVC